MKSSLRKVLSFILIIVIMLQIFTTDAFTSDSSNRISIGDFAIISLSDKSPIQINGSKVNITGDIHTNNNFIFSGSSIVISGTCEASGKVNLQCAERIITSIAEKVNAGI